jgi:hypothetical protein
MNLLTQQSVMMASVGAVDPFFASVSDLLHFDGNLTDIKTKTWTPTGSPTYDTTTPLFGSGAIVFSGTTKYVVSASSTVHNFGTGDFTIEFAIKFPAGSTPASTYIFDAGAGNLTAVQFTPSGTLAYYDPVTDTAGALYNNGPDNSLVADGNWHRVAIVRISSIITAYFDGVAWGSQSGANHNKTHTTLCLNKYGGDATHGSTNLSMDELRVTKGVGRYSANYTPATAAFPNS